MAIEVGRVCMKIAGHEAGKYCTVLKKLNNNFVLVNGPKILTGVKRRKCNLDHLDSLPYILQITENATDEELIQAYKKAHLIDKFNLKLPSAADLKAVPKVEGKEEVKEVKKEVKKEAVKEEPKKEEKKVKAEKEKKKETKKEEKK